MLGQRPMVVEDFMRILRRRFWLALIPAGIVCVATYLVSLKIPNRFTSQTLILIEQQKVPDSYVKSIVTGELNERLASMQEQILSRTRLQPEVQRFDLYNDSGWPMDEKVDELRKAIIVTPVRPMAETGANELPGFEIAVTLNTARVAQQVCTDITSMFIEESLKERQSEAEGTTQFLNKELEEAQQNLDQQGQKLATFKEKYIGEMPQDEQTNMNLLNALNTQLDAVNQALNRDQQTRTFDQGLLDEQLALAKKANENPDEAVAANPETLDQQLQRAETDLTELRSQFTDSYPDVIAKKAEIEQLKQKMNDSKATTTKTDAARTDASKSGSDSGKADGSATVADAQASDAQKVQAPGNSVPESPQIRQLRTQLFLVNQDIHDKSKLQDRLRTEIGQYESRVHLSPVVEQQLEQLTRDQATAKDVYDDRLKKRDNARMATNLELRQQGETFNVLDPASLPEKPSFPNRPLFAGGGLAGGLALGVGLILLFEYRDKSIVGEPDVEFFLKLPTLAAVPYIEPGKRTKLAGIFRRFKPKQRAEANA